MADPHPRESTSQIVGLPAISSEIYLTREELADVLRVSVPTVDRMRRAGMPSVTWGRRTRRFPKATAVAWAHAQQREAA